ncbi:MAG: hypothetical protein F6J97_22270, partial [Leptolyngbya sp. SIO4C1]|nr:hypothetical protein [Leptolyngbya sp. SIO4C1]
MSSHFPNPVNGLIEMARATKAAIKKLAEDRQWDVLLIVATISIWFLFNPNDGAALKVKYENIPKDLPE